MAICYKDVTFVIQGSISFEGEQNITLKCIESIKQFYPHAAIILSTWEYDSLVSDIEVLVNDDPGAIETKNKYFTNYNRMLVSTSGGVKHAKTKYVAKIRSDFWFEKYYPILENFLAISQTSSCLVPGLSGKIMMCMCRGHYSLFPYFISDWFQFGLKEDMVKLWGSKLITEKDKHESNFNRLNFFKKPFYYCDVAPLMDYPFHSEQQLCLGLMNSIGKHTPSSFIGLGFFELIKSYLLLGKVFFVISRYDLGLRSYKHNVIADKNDTLIWDLAFQSSFSKLAIIKLVLFLLFDYFKMQYILFKLFARKHFLPK